MAQTVGSIQVVATINTKDYETGKKQIEKGNEQLEGNANKTSKSFSAAWTGAIAGVAAALTTKFLGAITSSIDGAVKRVDTLNNSSRTFMNMGISATDSSKAMTALEKSIKGLPTPLDSAVAGMTALTATYGDINKGQKIFSALNNAILGFGGSSAMVENAITQLSQLPMDGPLDAATWNSLRNSGITPVLAAMAKDSGMSVSALKTAFGDGTLTVEDFTNKLMKLNTEGGGGLASLEKIAGDSTSGIATGFANMQTAITRGIASIIQEVGSANISSAISSIGDGFTFVLKGVSGLINFIKSNSAVFSSLAVSFVVAGTAVVAYTTYIKAAAAFTAAYTAVSSYLTLVNSLQAQGLGVLRSAWLALNIVMRANPIGLIITLIASLVAGIIWFFTQTELGKNIFENAFKFIQQVISNVFNWIKDNWPLLLAIISGPIALAVFAIVKNFDKIKAAALMVWNWIKDTFSSIGQIAANIIRTPVNAILAFAENTINGFIRGINSAIKLINKIPGVNLPTFSSLNIPQLATGGITTGPTLAMIGEGAEQEAVLPLSKLDALINGNGGSGGDTYNTTVYASADMIRTENDKREFATMIVDSFNQTRRAKGLQPIGQ